MIVAVLQLASASLFARNASAPLPALRLLARSNASQSSHEQVGRHKVWLRSKERGVPP
jgi:hypothetical protein